MKRHSTCAVLIQCLGSVLNIYNVHLEPHVIYKILDIAYSLDFEKTTAGKTKGFCQLSSHNVTRSQCCSV